MQFEFRYLHTAICCALCCIILSCDDVFSHDGQVTEPTRMCRPDRIVWLFIAMLTKLVFGGTLASILCLLVLCVHFISSPRHVDLLEAKHSEMYQLLRVAEEIGAAKIEARRLTQSVDALHADDLRHFPERQIKRGISSLAAVAKEASSLHDAALKAVALEESFLDRSRRANSALNQISYKTSGAQSSLVFYKSPLVIAIIAVSIMMPSIKTKKCSCRF